MNKYFEIYKKLNIKNKPLDKNYKPEEFAYNLIAGHKKTDKIYYSASTTLDDDYNNELKCNY